MLKANNFREWAEMINNGQRNEYKKPQFKPYIYIKNINRQPTQLFPVAILGIAHFKHLPVPDKVAGKTLWQQIEMIRDMIHKHFNKWGGKRTKPWVAQIGVFGKNIHLGYFGTPEEAYRAYCEAAKKHFGEFAHF